jgi:Zn-dependent protease with chaperone function
MNLVVCAVIVLFFGLLIGAFFELFRFLDFLLNRSWEPTVSDAALLLASVVIGWLVIRIAWRIAILMIGVLTPKYDERPDSQATLPLDREANSVLHDVVIDVCRQVGAPQPDEIRIASVAECYVLEQRRFSIRTDRQLILVLGLPELLMLTVAELRVIVAHELVHFRNHHTTAVVFLFRFLESLRRAWEPLAQRSWHRADPIFWFFWCFHRLVSWLCQPIQRHHELHADAVSAGAYGGDLAVRTLLKDWLLAHEFDSAVEDFRSRLTDHKISVRGNIYRFFVDRSREFSPESQKYLEDRFLDEAEDDSQDGRPSMRRRLLLLRSFPDVPTGESRPASELLADVNGLQEQLHALMMPTLAASGKSADEAN